MPAINPKDAIGVNKTPINVIPATVVGEIGVAMLEGALRYGRHNYRVAPVRASIYYDAVWRHLAAWWEGEDLDAVSGLSHITKAIASLVVLRDAMINDRWRDDRPPPSPSGWLDALNAKTAVLVAKSSGSAAALPSTVEPTTDDPIGPLSPSECE